MLASILPRSNMPYFWVDVLCLNQKDPPMKIIRQSDKIYEQANEYHVMGLRTFDRGWCVSEVGACPGFGREAMHLDLPGETGRLEKAFTRKRNLRASALSFDTSNFFDDTAEWARLNPGKEPSDRSAVRGQIIRRWGSVDKFDQHLDRTVKACLQ